MKQTWLSEGIRVVRSTDPDHKVTNRAARRIGLQVAALSAVMVFSGAVLIFGYLWFIARYDITQRHDPDIVWVAIEPDDLAEAAVVVMAGVIVLAGLGAMLFAGQAVKPLEESLRRQRNFIGDASHELRTPLAVLDARIQQLQMMADDDARLAPIISELRTDSRVMIEIVNDLLTSASVADVNVEPANLQTVIEQVRAELAPIAREHGVILTVSDNDPSSTGEVAVPDIPLRRSILALVDNAIAHSSKGKPVTIETSTERHWRVVRVVDEGQGITGIEPERVFERFARGDSDSGPQASRSSHGIGLSLVHDVVSRYGGTVEVERTGADGTVFQLRLPTPRNWKRYSWTNRSRPHVGLKIARRRDPE